MAGAIKIRISAFQDRTVDATFGDIEKRALKVRDNLRKNLGGPAAAKGVAQIGKEAEKSLGAAAKAGEKAAKKIQSDQEKAASAAARAYEKAQRTVERALGQTTRMTEREAAKQSAVIERETQKQFRAREKFAGRTSGRAVRFLFPPPSGIIGNARRTASEIARGAGIDWSVAGSVSRSVDLSAQVTRLQNQASLNGQNISHTDLEGSIKRSSDKYGFGRGDAAGALGAFADRTGDMKLGMDVLPQLAERAAASGSSLEDMLSAAGEVAMNLGPVKEKSKALVGVLDAMIQQGAKGAIEMKDLAGSGMARIGANAGRFEGDAGNNMKKLGALAQLARQSGGAATAAEAGTAVARLTDQFTVAARVKAFKAQGVNVYSTKEKGQLRDPIETIKDSLLATKGDPEKMKKLFMSSVGAKPVLALTKTFNEAGGGKAGTDAIDKLIASFMQTGDIQKQLDEANKRRDAEVATKAQKFQNELDDVASKMAGELLPALESMKGPALQVAGAFSSMVSWAAQNPWEAIPLAITAAIARAGLESAFRASIEKAITGGAINVSGGMALKAGSVALAAASVAWAVDEERQLANLSGGQEGVWEGIKSTFRGEGFFKGVDDYQNAKAKKEREEADFKLSGDGPGSSGNNGKKDPNARLNPEGPIQDGITAFKTPVNRQQGIDPSQLATGVAAGLKSAGVLEVRVINMPTTGAPGPVVSPKGRSK